MYAKSAKIWQFLGWNTQGDIGPFTCYTASDHRLVIFDQAPPKEPASRDQTIQRNRFRLAAQAWKLLGPAGRNTWNQAASAARLRITGYNLYTYWLLTADRAAIRTVENQSRTKLIQ